METVAYLVYPRDNHGYSPSVVVRLKRKRGEKHSMHEVAAAGAAEFRRVEGLEFDIDDLDGHTI